MTANGRIVLTSELKAACRLDFTTFCELTLPILVPNVQWFPYMDLLCATVEDCLLMRRPRVVISMPPRHLKTAIGSVLGCAWALGVDPKSQIIVASHSQTLAREIADQTKRVMTSDPYRAIFPETEIRPDRERASDFGTTAGGGRLGASFDTSLTGRGADIIVIDDPLSAQDAGSEKERQFVVDSFSNMIATRLNDPTRSAILVIGQRLHRQDLNGYLLDNGYDHLKLSLEATDAEEFDYGRGRFSRKAGEVLQPDRYGEEAVAKLKLTTPPHIFATQYQQVPTAISSGLVRREHFAPYATVPQNCRTIVSWDLASSRGPSSSYTVGLCFKLSGEIAYLEHVYRQRLDFAEIKQLAFDIEHRGGALHLIENASLGSALAAELMQAGANVVLCSPGAQSKIERLEAQLHHIIGGRVALPDHAPWLEAFLDEVTSFPYGSRDDQVDALSQFLKWISERVSEPEFKPLLRTFGSGSGGRKTDSARWRDMVERYGTRRAFR